MSEGLIEKVKRSVIEGTQVAMAKVEETTRIAKLKIDLVAEENNLRQKYADLGEILFTLQQASQLDAIATDTRIIDLSAKITENLARMEELKEKLRAMQPDKPCCCC